MKRYIKAYYEDFENTEDMFEELEYDLKNEVYSFYPDEEYMDVNVRFNKKNNTDSVYDIIVSTDYFDIDDIDELSDELDNVISIVYEKELDILDMFRWDAKNSFIAKVKINIR